MKTTSILIAALLAIGVTSAAWAYEGGAVADGGKITGTVKFQGQAPKPKPIDITKDKQVCAKEAKIDPSLLVGSNGGLQNAVVMITSIAKGKAMDSEKSVLRQKGCEYVPHVFMAPAGAEIDITNEDGILHNIHTYSEANPPVNRAQPKFKKVINEKFEKPEIFQVRCDAHGWMSAWIVVKDHPYYAVTDASGSYSLDDVPAGDYEVRVWHETLGDKIQKVSVAAAGAATANFELAAK